MQEWGYFYPDPSVPLQTLESNWKETYHQKKLVKNLSAWYAKGAPSPMDLKLLVDLDLGMILNAEKPRASQLI
jgi:hypothetical protein